MDPSYQKETQVLAQTNQPPIPGRASQAIALFAPHQFAPNQNYSSHSSPSTYGTTWDLDNGASNHITPDLEGLSLHPPYNGPFKVAVGNGHGLQISNTASGQFFEQGDSSRPH